MNKIVKNLSGFFFVKGSGFPTTDAKAATRLSADEASCTVNCAASMGFPGATVEDAPALVSFAPCYVRKSDINPDGSIKANVKNPSRRRFATREEADTHGRRFSVRKSSFGSAPGSAGHIGYYVIETNDPVNSAVNPATGLTNPANGAPRTYVERQAAGTTVAQINAKLGIS